MPTSATPDAGFSHALELLQAGRLAEAEQQIDLVSTAQPDKFEPHHLGAVIAFQSGRREVAITRLRQALDIMPDHAQGLSDLGMMLNAIGARDEAETVLVRALDLAPGLAAAHLNLGNVLSDSGKQLRAERHFREALRLKPRMGAAMHNLSRVLLSAGKVKEAVDLAQRLIDLAPKNALGHSRLALALDRLGRLEEAIAAHEKAVALRPNDNGIRLSYARSLAGYGRIDAAIAQSRKAIENDPDDVSALVQLSGLVKLSEEPELLARMTEMWTSADVPDAARAGIGFELAKAEEKNRNYTLAFDTMVTANRMVRDNVRYNPTLSGANADDVIAAFSPDRLQRLSGGVQGPGHGDASPIFIVGMPRSGTTLTEQILCAHPDVFGAGEPAVMRSVTEQASAQLGVTTLVGLMEGVDAAMLQRLGADYAALMRHYSAGATKIVDKVPANFTFVGLIHLCLPNAKIVHCRRSPADTCLSVFKNRFATGSQAFSYDLDDLAAYYAAYTKIMAHWEAVLPGVVHTVQYEQMVAEQRAQSEKLYAHCGLDWTDEALAFFKTERPVHTASVSQVRQPIYDASSGIAGRYGAAARPLIEALERAGIDPFAL